MHPMRAPVAAVGWLLSLAVMLLVAGCQTTTTVNGVEVSNAPRSPVGDGDVRKRAQSRLSLATAYYQQRQLQVAIEETRRALLIDPNFAAAYGLLGLIYLDMDDQREAEANFNRALRIEPDNPEFINNYGWYLCRNGRERDSIDWFERAARTKQYATPALPLQNAGLCLMKVGDPKGAEQYLRRSFEIDASSPVVKYNLARLYLGTRQLERAGFYYGLLEQSVDPSAETLWLGLRIARARGDVRVERQFADELVRRFPASLEAGLLRRGAFDE